MGLWRRWPLVVIARLRGVYILDVSAWSIIAAPSMLRQLLCLRSDATILTSRRRAAISRLLVIVRHDAQKSRRDTTKEEVDTSFPTE